MPVSEEVKEILNKIENEAQRTLILEQLAALTIDDFEKTRKQNCIELYKLEYEKCAERYENIYKAIWTNFSYMSVVAGAILTFGSNFYPNATLIAFLACLPLLFWYFATFIPMNRYGYANVGRLAEIEQTLNQEFKTELKHYTDSFNSSKSGNIYNKARVGPIMFAFLSLLLFVAIYFCTQYMFDKSVLLQAPDIKVTEAFVNRIKEQPPVPPPDTPAEQSPEQELNQIIQSKLSDTTKKLLNEFNPNMPTKELQRNLALDLNKVIEGKPLYNEKSQNHNMLGNGSDIPNLFAQPKTADELLHANRTFLERAFPAEINPASFFLNSLANNIPGHIFIWLVTFLGLLPLVVIIVYSFLSELCRQIIKPILKPNEKWSFNFTNTLSALGIIVIAVLLIVWGW